MSNEALYEFYEHVILPQFGISGLNIVWGAHKKIGPDEDAHYFSEDTYDNYILLFADYDIPDDKTLSRLLGLSTEHFEHVPINSTTKDPTSTLRLSFPTPYQYIHNVTGTFALLHDYS